MILRLANLFLIILIVLVAFAGCDRTQNVVTGTMPSADATMDDTITDMEAIPVSLVWLVDYPEGQRMRILNGLGPLHPHCKPPQRSIG